ncbi:GDP-mannose transporter into the lumen of the Golgi [Venturia effusa]|uniref:GDP-mannose transporter n=1 Tax=Venturia effusa TaxID=50376 RepID=A0A517KZB2_9PEZI|nr:GDP-mannose transporter into the lumen of the Golgi [Venturia effusa]
MASEKKREDDPTASVSAVNNPTVALLCYCASSILMTVTNKYVLSGMNFNLNFLLLCVQSAVALLAIQTCKTIGIFQYRDFKLDEAKKWFPISLLLIALIYTGSKALQYLSVPVYTIFKNMAIIVTAYAEMLWFGGSNVSRMTLFSFGLMVLSSIIAAWADIQHALTASSSTTEAHSSISTLNAGYTWMAINCFCAAAFTLSLRKKIKVLGFKDLDTMFYNNLLPIPVLLAASLFLEDWSSANLEKNFPPEQRLTIISVMVFSGMSAVFISYTQGWCLRVGTSTTFSMVGALNKLPLSIVGLVFFDAPVTFGSVSAIICGFVSGIVYTLAKLQQSAKAQLLPTVAPKA